MKLTIKEIHDIETEMLKEIHDICERHQIKYYLVYGSVLGAVRHQGPIPWDTDADIVIPYHQLNDFERVMREELPSKFKIDTCYTQKGHTALFPRIGLKGYSTRTLHIDVFLLVGTPKEKEEQKDFKRKLEDLQTKHFYKNVMFPDLGKLNWKGKLKIIIYKFFYLHYKNDSLRQKFFELCLKYEYNTSQELVNASGGYGMKEFIARNLFGEGMVQSYNNINVKVPENYEEYLTHFYGDYNKLPPKKERQTKSHYIIKRLK